MWSTFQGKNSIKKNRITNSIKKNRPLWWNDLVATTLAKGPNLAPFTVAPPDSMSLLMVYNMKYKTALGKRSAKNVCYESNQAFRRWFDSRK